MAASPPQQPHPALLPVYKFLYDSQEVCWKKAVVASVSGIGLGIGFGTFLGTFEGAHGEIVGDTMLQQLKYGFRKTYYASLERSIYFAKQFSVLGGIFMLIECPLERHRARHDIFNPFIAGTSTGAIVGAVAARQLPWKVALRHAAKSGAGFGAFTAVFELGLNYLKE